MLLQKVNNLLAAGRCVAGDKVSHAAARQMMYCSVTGRGTGVAAAVLVSARDQHDDARTKTGGQKRP
jgi:hypothetical protein